MLYITLSDHSSVFVLLGNYGSAAIISGVAGILFWICFRHLDKEEDALNLIGAKQVEATVSPNELNRGTSRAHGEKSV